jgi:type I restriction enzyme S subunit
LITDLKPYSSMKDSGVPWLREVPEHWEIRRLRTAAGTRVSNVDKHTKDGELPVRLCNYVDVYKNNRIRESMTFMRATATADEIQRFHLKIGDVLITKDSETWDDIGVPALVDESADDLVCGYHLALLRPSSDRLLGGYLFRAIQSTGVAYQFHVEANGVTRYGLSHEAIKSVGLPVPPIFEQAAIVRFLDYADRRIRRYIRAKQKLIKLLEEQKQAIVHRAVTRGLDPDVRLKPSGVEWLGDVPEHWEVLKLARMIADGPRNGTSPPIDERGTIESFSISAIRDGQVDVRDGDKKYISGDRIALETAYRLLRGDVLLVRGNGNVRLVGRAGLVTHDMPGRVYPDLLMRIRLTRRCVPEFLVASLTCPAGRDQIETAARTAVGTFKINNHQVRQLCFAFPPVAEQKSIIDWLSDSLGALKTASSRAEEEIALLREYRTRLIADVVTGKLDVREAAARLPVEGEETEPLEESDALADSDFEPADDLDAAPAEADV